MTRVIPCGTKVTTIINSIDGIITCVSIRFNNVSYEVSYFSDMDYKTMWLNECEFTFSGKRKSIGFASE